nr:DEAD/DEAH box helicase [Bifidobacterium samirii]
MPVVEVRPVPFRELGVPEPLLRVLAADGKTDAFPIQADTLPDSLSGRDVLGRGRTGSGKTLAFCIPLAARLCAAPWHDRMTMADYRRLIKQDRRRRHDERVADGFLPHPRGLILVPTRELANQINDVLAPLAQMSGLETTTVYGGVRYSRQARDLRAGADIVVACPGRLEDLLRQNMLTLADVEVVVLDEADEMADMGFLPPVKRILGQIRPDAQHMLFSATLDHGVDGVVREFLRDPKTHSVDEPTAASDTMTQHVFEVAKSDKSEVVRVLASGKGRRILFTRTKFQAKKLAKSLTHNGIPAAELHGNLSQNQRDRNLAAFENGAANVLVATDVAARGIDISNVELVVQVDPPEDPKSFVHRSGRTARAGRTGDVVTLVMPDQRREARRMLKAAGIRVKSVEVRHESPEVLALMGERADAVNGWSLDQAQPAGNPRRTRGGAAGASKGGGRRRRGRNADAWELPDIALEAEADAKAFAHLPADGVIDGTVDTSEAASRDMAASDGGATRLTPGKARRRRHEPRRGAEAEAGARGKAGEGTSASDGKSGKSDGNAKRGGQRGKGRKYVERQERLAQGEATKERRSADHGRADRTDRRDGRDMADARGERRGGAGGRRIHRKDENRIVVDERSEDVKRHERRMAARRGNAPAPRRHRSKMHKVPFRTR